MAVITVEKLRPLEKDPKLGGFTHTSGAAVLGVRVVERMGLLALEMLLQDLYSLK